MLRCITIIIIGLALASSACLASDAHETVLLDETSETSETSETPLDLGLSTEPLDEYGCKIGGCCDCSQVSSTGTNMCMGCSGAMSAADCSGQTYVPCPPDMCFIYGGKFSYKPGASWAPSACK